MFGHIGSFKDASPPVSRFMEGPSFLEHTYFLPP